VAGYNGVLVRRSGGTAVCGATVGGNGGSGGAAGTGGPGGVAGNKGARRGKRDRHALSKICSIHSINDNIMDTKVIKMFLSKLHFLKYYQHY